MTIRILHVIPAEEEGPMMIFVKKQVASLQRSGMLNYSFFLASRTSPSIIFTERKRFLQAIQSFRPMIVHAHYGTMTGFFCITVTNLPLVVTYRGNDLNTQLDRAWKSILGLIFSQITALRAKHIICVSERLKQRLWWRKEGVSIIPSGVDTTIFYPRPKEEARKELGWGMEEKVVLFNVSRDPAVKRVNLAQAAVGIAEKMVGKIRFVTMNGHCDPELVPIWMNAADCLLLTSRTEGSPNVVKEGIACNLPVVSVDVGDVRERLAGVCPSRIVEGDPQKIAKGLAEILLENIRSNGHDLIQELSLDKIASRIISIYEKVIA